MIFADAAPAGTERLLNFGALGVIVLLFITGWIVTGSQYRKLDAKYEEQQRYVTETVVPLLERATRALENNTEVIRMLIGHQPPTEGGRGDLPLAQGHPTAPEEGQ
ncbi:MAG TPA: hypothetical protein VIT65_20545 [Microlunatus sp.]